MTTAQWRNESVRHGGCLQRASLADLPVFAAGRCNHAKAGGASCASMESFTADWDGRQFRCRTPASGKSRTRIRRRKVQAIRRQIKDGAYRVDWRLATILDKMFEDLVTQAGRSGRPQSRHSEGTSARR
jgi:hypothetical protein